jgi:hypothetical protein
MGARSRRIGRRWSAAGISAFTLTVTDDAGASNSADVIISVAAR